MKKRVLALLMCVLLALGSVPAMPVTDLLSIEARAVNIENLEAAIASVPDEDEWYKFINTTALSAYYGIAVQVMQNPDGFTQDYIDTCAKNLDDAVKALQYHTLGIVLNESTYSAAVGNKFTLRAILDPQEAADPVSWSSDNPQAVSVTDEGVVTVNKYSAEPVNVIATSNGLSAYCTVTILNPLGGITLDSKEITIFEGDRTEIRASAYGKDATALPTDEVTYSYISNNTSVATVNADGIITGLKKGQTTVTVTATNGSDIYSATCTVTVNETIPVKSLSSAELTNTSTINLTVNENRTINVIVLPTNASNKTLMWTSSDESVVAISEEKTSATGSASAVLTALKAGSSQITFATTDGTNISKTFTVVVKPLISSLAFTTDIKVLTPTTSGERFSTVILPADAGNQVLTWTSSDTTVCKVDYNGVLYPQSLGTCEITATTQDGTNIRVKGFVRVSEMAAAVTVNKSTLTLDVPDTYKLSATVAAIDGSTYNDVLWTSGDTKIASVDKNGVVTAKYPGTVVIKAMALDGTEKYDTCILTVNQPLEGLTLPESKGVYVGGTVTIPATFEPEYASNKKVTWTSSDKTVAVVDENGVVTGKSTGKATITCTAEDGGHVATCVVTVLIATTGVTLNYTNAKIWKDKTITLIPTITPENATNKNVEWTSSDTSVAVVDENGVVTGVAGGSCVITCTTKNSAKTATCTVTVLESVTGVAFASDSLSLYLGQVYTNKASVIPSTATNKNISYATGNDLVVRVSQSGELTAVGEGTAIVTAKSEDGGFVAACEVKVYSKVPVTGLTLDKTTLSLDVGEYYTFLATVHPDNASDKGITWRTDNSSVVAVAQTGLIKAKSVGTAIITATTDDGNFTRQCKVIVTQPVTGIRLNAASVTIAKGKSKTLIANVLPTNATNKEIIWESTDEDVARVSSTGVVTAVGEGNCTITATTVDGLHTASCDFSVYIPVTGITISADSIKIPRGETRLLSATIKPADASNKSIIWQSSNTGVATVNEAGQVTGRMRGTAVIYATSSDGAFQAECTVEVVQLATSVSLNYASITLDVGTYKQFTATLTPATVSDTTVRWSTSDKNVVAVSSKGLIKGVGPGVATITCRSGDGAVKTTCKITVTQPVTGLTLDPTAMAVREGGIRAITATIKPANATDSKVIWLSSDNSIATVDSDGIVHGIRPGIVTITAISNNNSDITATCTAKVIRSVTAMSLNKTSITMNVGNTTTVKPVFTPADAGIQTAKWTSSNYDVADVDSNGKITAKAPGFAIITATSTDGGFTATCSVLCIQPVTGVKLSESSISLEVDEKFTLVPSVLPANASDSSVRWSSSDKSVATVSSKGVVTGKDQGTATITCTTVDGSYKATCKVTVLKKVTGISLNYSSKVLYLNKTLQLKATVTPTDATNKGVYWYSGNKNIATVNQNGLVTPVSPGSVTIGVRTNDGSFKAYCKLEIRKPVEKISLNKSSLTIYVDDYYQLAATVLPDDATVKDVSWSVSDPTVLALSSKGLIKGKSAGTATVTATAENGLTATCKVTVLQSVEGIGLDKDVLTVYTGESATINATVLPEGAYNQGVKWNSSNPNVAKVSTSGVVTGIKAGYAVITATTSEGGYSATCTVTVNQHVTSIGFNTTKLDIPKGSQDVLSVSVLPADATDKSYEITSSDPGTVFVDQNGMVIALKGGSATITVTAKDNGKTGTCFVTVLEPVTGVSLEKKEEPVYVGDKLSLKATVTPSDATNQAVTWSSSEPEVASVDSKGVITVLKSGEALITVTTVDGGFTDSCVLTCLQAPETIETEKEISVLRGEEGTLSVTVLPENSFNKNVTFTSDNESVVTIDGEGNYKALAPGQATITVKAEMGEAETTCLITVIEPVTSVQLEETEITVYKDSTYDFNAVVYPLNASNQKVVWKVSSGAVARVNQSGQLTALSKGETYVTVTTVDGKFIDFCKVNVVLPVEGIETEKDSFTLNEGDTAEIIAKLLPEDAYDTSIRYESDDSSIAKVENGVITAVSKGETFISVTSVDNPQVSKRISVNVIRLVDDIELSFDKEYLWVGESGTVSVELIPAEPTDGSVTYKSSDETIATVDENGVVNAIGAGEAVITVTTTDERATKDITVEVRQQVEGVELSEAEKTVSVDDVFTLTATVLPSDAYNKEVEWISSDETVLTVVDGEVTALKTGEATITAVSKENGELKASCKITVIRMAESVELTFDKEYLWVGESGTVTATVLPEDTTDKSVTYKSSDETIATVDENGVVKAIGAGEAVITVTTTDERATKDITVEVRQQVEGVELSEAEKTVSVDDVFTLTANVLPANAYNKEVEWISSDETVLTVVDGEITALKTGEATITAVSKENGELKASCKITVIRMAESVELTFDKEYLWVGESGTVTATVLPEDTTDKSVSYKSSDESIIRIDADGNITALGAGTATVSVQTTDGRAIDFIQLEVRQQVEGIEINEVEKTVKVDDVFTLTANVLPANAYNKEVEWISSDETVLTVVDGEVTALKTGEATITAVLKEKGEIKAFCLVKVIRYIDNVSFKESAVTVLKGEEYQLEVTILPDDATERELSWSSSDDSTVTVDENGKITALKAGSATIRVQTALESVFAECVVTVEVKSEEVRLDKTEAEIYCGDTLTLNATVLPEDCTNKKVIWESKDENIATVDENGVVTAKDKGVVTITATTEDTGKTAECVITVLRHVSSVEMSSHSVSAYVGREFTLEASVKPLDATNQNIIWKTSDSSVACVDSNGKVSPISKGTAIISVFSEDGGYADFCFVKVGIGIEALAMSEEKISIDKEESHTLTVKISPDDATAKDIIWTSSDDTVATVENGTITATRKSGVVTIRATAADNSEAYAECEVTVIEPVTAVDLNKTELQLLIGKSETLVPIITPLNATNKDVTFTSSDDGVAVVDENGVVTAVAPGTADITCTSTDSGISAVCKVFVPRPVESFSISIASLSISKGASADIIVEATPDDHDESFTFASSDNTVLTVDSKTGVVTGVGAGTATVTAVSSLTGKTATVDILVVQPVESIRLELSEYNGAYTGLTHQLRYTISPENAYNKKVKWSSSDESIATVDDEGYITYHKKGQVTITVTSLEAGLKAECKVTVSQSPEEIYISSATKTLAIGEKTQLTVAVLPIDSANQTVIWTSSAPGVVSVDQSGNIEALLPGTAVITATTWNGKSASCTVTVE